MTFNTRLTDRFGIEHPVVLAPMDDVADARLASAVSAAGGLGLLGGGYADADWSAPTVRPGVRRGGMWIHHLDPEGKRARPGARTGTRPGRALLSFGDPAPYAPRIRAAGVPLICQVHNIRQAARAIEVGADVIVAQGGEAGGHGEGRRSTFTLVPEVVDLVAGTAPQILVLAAGGVTDGRGLAASLALGADGVLVGTRFWAAGEAAISRAAQRHALQVGGDDTIRQHVYDIVRGKRWPSAYSGRVLRNDFVDKWHRREAELAQHLDQARSEYQSGVAAEDYRTANLIVGEGIGQVRSVESVADIIESMVAQAAAINSTSRS